MKDKVHTSKSLAAAITKTASLQTYLTIRVLVDRERVQDAYRAYAYFRWVDDIIDGKAVSQGAPGQIENSEELAFINRQKEFLLACYRGETLDPVCREEQMLVELVRNDSGKNSGLRSYLDNMMGVMEFDAERRGRIISHAELAEYSRMLAIAVTDGLYYFIGHDEPVPTQEARYLAVTAAHITHMIRDTQEDTEVGYYNIPGEYLQAQRISPRDVGSKGYRAWVCDRVGLARLYFKAGRAFIAQDRNLYRRLAGYAYTARFTWMLGTIERDNYCLRSEYRDRKSLSAGMWMVWTVLASLLASIWTKPMPQIQAHKSTNASSRKIF